MSAEQNTTAATAEVLEQEQSAGVYASLFKKINLSPVDQLSDIRGWRDEADMAEAGANQRVTAALGVFLEQLRQSGTQKVDKLDKALLDQMIGELDRQLSQDLDKILHHPEFQKVESLWRGVEHLIS
uniref:type VI secretion system contractile sheath domain-containing protein n=1 Tax=Enterobacter ludwigii TaxID=299767 RepID=UPI003F6EB3E4